MRDVAEKFRPIRDALRRQQFSKFRLEIAFADEDQFPFQVPNLAECRRQRPEALRLDQAADIPDHGLAGVRGTNWASATSPLGQ